MGTPTQAFPSCIRVSFSRRLLGTAITFRVRIPNCLPLGGWNTCSHISYSNTVSCTGHPPTGSYTLLPHMRRYTSTLNRDGTTRFFHRFGRFRSNPRLRTKYPLKFFWIMVLASLFMAYNRAPSENALLTKLAINICRAFLFLRLF